MAKIGQFSGMHISVVYEIERHPNEAEGLPY